MIPLHPESPPGLALRKIYATVGPGSFTFDDLEPEDRRFLRGMMAPLRSGGVVRRIARGSNHASATWQLTRAAVKRAQKWEQELLRGDLS